MSEARDAVDDAASDNEDEFGGHAYALPRAPLLRSARALE